MRAENEFPGEFTVIFEFEINFPPFSAGFFEISAYFRAFNPVA
jgi:hypothetical protein